LPSPFPQDASEQFVTCQATTGIQRGASGREIECAAFDRFPQMRVLPNAFGVGTLHLDGSARGRHLDSSHWDEA
jgi:hypothetical protein